MATGSKKTKNHKKVKAAGKDYFEVMKRVYGFDGRAASLIKAVAAKTDDFYSAMAVPTYGTQLKYGLTGNIRTKTLEKACAKAGLSSDDARYLNEAIIKQHKKPGLKDFAHEMASIAIFFKSGKGEIGMLGNIKGDVYSGSFDLIDKRTDIDAYNIYKLGKGKKTSFADFVKYNAGVLSGAVDSRYEFLKNYGGGNAVHGRKKIEKDLNRRSPGASIILRSAKRSHGMTKEKVKSEIADFLDFLDN
ncbi:MAG: hypothetical protein IJL87_08910 [Clostridia bacterium]|nr:hypothetical protein [Clostridia bacterium]